MTLSPWERRNRRILWTIGITVVVVALLFLYCRGPAGLPRILGLARQQRKLQQEVLELKGRAVVQRSDIEELKKPGTVQRIAHDRYGMEPAPKTDSAASQ